MNSVMRLVLLTPFALASLALGACQQDAPAPQASHSAEAAEPATKQGITASDGKLVLPAVKGRPGAAYFMLSNSDTKPVAIDSIAIAGAGKAEMHETKGGEMVRLTTAEIPAGNMVLFDRGGKHVMVFDLAPTIKAGSTVEMTLTFSDGGKVSVPLAVETAGGAKGGGSAKGGADAMDHGAMR